MISPFALQLFFLLAFPQQQPSQGVYRVGGGVTPPVPVYRVEPQFDELAREALFQGTVLIKTIVDAEGRATDPQVVKSVGLGLDEEALAAVRQWKFKPGTKDGQPVPVYAQIEITFRLLDSPVDTSWMAAAASSGIRGDQARLGKAFYWGNGVTQDYAQALNWFQKAASQDDARSESYLGMMYSQGQGVAKNSVEAERWFRSAAEQNDVIGQLNLGKGYMNGDGLPVEYVQAYKWLSLAIKHKGQDAQAASLRDQVTLKMAPAEIVEAEALAGKWQPRVAASGSRQN